MLPLITAFLPFLFGAVLGFSPVKTVKSKKGLFSVTAGASALTLVFAALTAALGGEIALFPLAKGFPLFFRADGAAKLFGVLAAAIWLPAVVYSRSYMREEDCKAEKRFDAFLLLSLGALLGVAYAGNLLTLYLFFESLTLLSLPLVLHNRTEEAIRAGKKYLFYSVCGAFLALPCICAVCLWAGKDGSFAPGGILDGEKLAGNGQILLVLVFLAILGFGAKAGMFPLHAWLTAAHPVSPAPASALLSGLIAKAGIFAVMRLVYGAVGTELLTGTWVQYTWLIIAMVTVFMGSMLALREKHFKRRLAYSSVSNLSYVMLGLALLSAEGLQGAWLHILAHALAKVTLFFVSGAVMHKLRATTVEELGNWSLKMPVTAWCFLLSSLSLVGIPPFLGFSSKWALCLGALGMPEILYGLIAPAVLVLSAMLTAGYLLPPVLRGFFPRKGEKGAEKAVEKCEADGGMLVPMLLLTAASLLLGIFSGQLTGTVLSFTGTML